MARIDSLKNFLTDVADSIRAKKGTIDLISPANFDTEIESIESGGDLSEYFDETIPTGNSNNYGWTYSVKKLPAMENETTDCTYMYYKFVGNEIDLTKLNKETITNVAYMFGACQNLTSLNLSDWNNHVITNYGFMFMSCSSMTDLDLSGLYTENATNFYQMFNGCKKLVNLNLINFDFSKVSASNVSSTCSNMFSNCSNLTNLIFGKNYGKGFTVTSENASNATLTLSSCTKLTETSLISILNSLYDIASLEVPAQKCTIGSTNLAKLTSEAGQQALAQATSYGWSIS